MGWGKIPNRRIELTQQKTDQSAWGIAIFLEKRNAKLTNQHRAMLNGIALARSSTQKTLRKKVVQIKAGTKLLGCPNFRILPPKRV